MRNAGLEETQDGIKIAGRNVNNFRYVDDTTPMVESKDELKSLLMKVKEESEKAGLKLNIQNAKIMASSPITSWQIDGEKWKQRQTLITADGDCSHEIKRCLLLGRKAMTNLDSMLKSRDISLLVKVHLVKAMVFLVVMYGCEKESESEDTQSFLTLCDPMDCSLPGSSVHGILQVRILEWIAMPFSRGSSQLRNRICVS